MSTLTAAESSNNICEISNNRKGRSGRKRKADDTLPSNKLKTHCHGCQGYLAYQKICKVYATTSVKHVIVDKWSLRQASFDIEEELIMIGVTFRNVVA